MRAASRNRVGIVPRPGTVDDARGALRGAALRWNQQFFGTIDDGQGRDRAWDRDIWRLDSAVGYRFTRHLQAKLQYSYSHQQGDLQEGEQLVAAQMTVKF